MRILVLGGVHGAGGRPPRRSVPAAPVATFEAEPETRRGARWALPGPLHTRRLGRYALTSVVATGASEATLLGVYGAHLLAASAAAVVASLAGIVPSYAMSRYWVWSEADRRRPGRQAAAFWVVALASLGLSSLLTGVAAGLAPPGHLVHVVVVGAAYVGTYGALWVAKFVVYQRFLFRPAMVATTGEPAADATGLGTAA